MYSSSNYALLCNFLEFLLVSCSQGRATTTLLTNAGGEADGFWWLCYAFENSPQGMQPLRKQMRYQQDRLVLTLLWGLYQSCKSRFVRRSTHWLHVQLQSQRLFQYRRGRQMLASSALLIQPQFSIISWDIYYEQNMAMALVQTGMLELVSQGQAGPNAPFILVVRAAYFLSSHPQKACLQGFRPQRQDRWRSISYE